MYTDKMAKKKPAAGLPARKRVKKLRSLLGAKTQAEAAGIVGVSRRAWQDWERGVTAVPLPVLRLIEHIRREREKTLIGA